MALTVREPFFRSTALGFVAMGALLAFGGCSGGVTGPGNGQNGPIPVANFNVSPNPPTSGAPPPAAQCSAAVVPDTLAPSAICNGPGPQINVASLSGMQFVAYWEGDTDLTQLPHGVTIVIASFGYLQGHAITGAEMGGNLTASTIAALHAKGVKILLSLGGGGGTFQFDGDVQGFQSSIKSLVAQLPYDGIDFDDENEGNNGESIPQRTEHLITLIPAAKTALGPNGIVTLSAYADPNAQDDGSVLKDPTAASALALINVMSYAGNNTQQSEDWTASYAPLVDKKKILLGVDVDGDGGGPPSAESLTSMAQWVRTGGYGGLMMWTVRTDAASIQAVNTGLGL
jgi:hypothetical protein